MMMKKKVIVVMRNLNMGGAENVLISFLKNFDRNKYDIQLVLHTKEGSLLNEVPEDVKITGLVPRDRGFLSKLIRGIYKRALFYTPNVIKISNLIKFGRKSVVISFMEGISTHIASTFIGPKAAWIHTNVLSNPWADTSFLNLKQQSKIYSQFNRLVFVSVYGELAFDKKFPNISVKKNIIHNVIDEHVIKQKSKVFDQKYNDWFDKTSGSKRLISVGRADEVKRFDLLINSFIQLTKSTEEHLTLTIIGDGAEYPNLLRMVKESGSKNIFLLGMKSNPMPYVKSSDLFINASRVESYPTVIAESLILKTPVLATRNGGAEEILLNEKFGVLVKNEITVSEFSESMAKALNNLSKLGIMAEEAVSSFTITKSLTLYDQLLNDLYLESERVDD